MVRALLALLLVLPGPALAQSLAGAWVYQGPNGTVRLSLEQTGATLAGTMASADGMTFAIHGTLQEGGATGTIRIGAGNGWFAAGLVGERLKLVVAEIDAATGQPDLDSGWELDFTRAGGQPPAPTPMGSPDGPAPAPAAGPPTPPSPLVSEWLGHLRGRKLSYRESYTTGGVGGYGGYSNNWDAWLCSDGTFLFRQTSSANLDTGGVTGLGTGGNEARGTWRLVENGGQPVLQYQMEGSAPQFGVLGFREGATYLDGSRIYVTDDNPYCR